MGNVTQSLWQIKMDVGARFMDNIHLHWFKLLYFVSGFFFIFLERIFFIVIIWSFYKLTPIIDSLTIP